MVALDRTKPFVSATEEWAAARRADGRPIKETVVGSIGEVAPWFVTMIAAAVVAFIGGFVTGLMF